MAEYIFHYSQGMDMRWYASEPVLAHGNKADAVTAMRAGKRVTFESGRWIEWMETSTSFGVCYALVAFWIIRRAKGEDFLQWLKPPSRACPEVGNNVNAGVGAVVADIKAMQISQHGKNVVFKLVDAVSKIKQDAALVERDSATVKTGPIKDKTGFTFIVITGERKGALGATDFGGQGGFSHAIATHVTAKDNVVLFDPNRGEIKLSCVAEAHQFIDYLCTNQKQYNLASYSLQWAGLAGQRIKKGQF